MHLLMYKVGYDILYTDAESFKRKSQNIKSQNVLSRV